MRDPKRRPATTGGASNSSAGRPQHDDTHPALFTTQVDRGADPNQHPRVHYGYEGRHRRDRGTKRAEHGSTATARHAGEDAIQRLAARGEFTADDVHDLIESEGGPTLPGPLVGALFLAASRRGEIESVGWATSDRPSRHGGPQRVWRGVGHG